MTKIQCKICKNIFCGRSYQKFCSKDCYSKWQSQNNRGDKHPGWKEKIKKICIDCGKLFETYPCKDKAKFCSRKCKDNHQKKDRRDKLPSWVSGRMGLGELIRKSSEYLQWRKQVYERDNWSCQECGKTKCYLEAHHLKSFPDILRDFLSEYSQFSPFEDKETLSRLSITYRPFWDINNGKTLCIDCHRNTDNWGRKNKPLAKKVEKQIKQLEE